MAGTLSGGKKAAQTNIKRFGPDWYRLIGSKGGQNGNTGGFYWMKQHGLDKKISAAGAKGGTKSRRTALTPEQKAERQKAKDAKYRQQIEQRMQRHQAELIRLKEQLDD